MVFGDCELFLYFADLGGICGKPFLTATVTVSAEGLSSVSEAVEPVLSQGMCCLTGSCPDLGHRPPRGLTKGSTGFPGMTSLALALPTGLTSHPAS